jgi:hypothetical protein
MQDLLHVYSVDQFQSLLEAAVLNRNAELAEGAVAMRFAQHGDKRGFDVFLRGLQRPEMRRPKRLTPEDAARLQKMFSGKEG